MLGEGVASTAWPPGRGVEILLPGTQVGAPRRSKEERSNGRNDAAASGSTRSNEVLPHGPDCHATDERMRADHLWQD